MMNPKTQPGACAGTRLPDLLPDGNIPRFQPGGRRPGVSIVEEDKGTRIHRRQKGLKGLDPVST